MSGSDDEKHLEELESVPDAQELLEQYQTFTEQLHDFHERRLEALKKLEEKQEHEKLHARQNFFEHHVAALEARVEHLETYENLEESVQEDLHVLAEKRKILEEMLEEQAQEAQEENRREYAHQRQELLELLEFLKEKRAHYEHVLVHEGGRVGVGHRPNLTPGGGHGHSDEGD